MQDYSAANLARWNELVDIHMSAEWYDLDSFKSGKSSLFPIEKSELGDVRGKSLLHLQCHFGLDSLSLARDGAFVMGLDFSENAITAARNLADEMNIKAHFIHSDVYNALECNIDQQDIIFVGLAQIRS